MNFFKTINWNKIFIKEEYKQSKDECMCKSSSGFFITRRQASAMSSTIIFLLTLILIFGYFWGQRKAIEEFTNKVVNDSFADQVNYSMYSLYGDNNLIAENTEAETDDEDPAEPKIEEKNEQINKVEQVQGSKVKETEKSIEPAEKLINSNISNVKHYAQLVGFGSKKSAEQFVNKVQKKGYNVFMVPRSSKTSSGKVITWYQVVTDKFDNETKLLEVANKIKKSERLGEIKFLTTNN